MMPAVIRVVLPSPLQALAKVGSEISVDVIGHVTQRSVIDAVEAAHPMLRGTIRDHVTKQRRAFVRFFACERDLSHEASDAPLPDAVADGREPLLVVGAMAGG
jgi:molybdopterin synthase sulfur carrier subunit